MKPKRTLRFGTLTVKTYTSGERTNRPLSIPIELAVNYEAPTSEIHGARFKSRAPEFYMRFGHPTLRSAAEKVALLEDAEAGLVFSSGMGAITTTLLTLCGHKDAHIVAQRQIFGQTFVFLSSILTKFGVTVTFVDANELTDIGKYIRDNTAFVYIESPSNPMLKVVDIESIARVTKVHGVPLVIDSTFASPALQNPINLGADIVIHSGTKFLSGHYDVMCGVCVGSESHISEIAYMQEILGTVLDPHAAWLLLRGIKTLNLRVPKQSESALAVAEFLQESVYIDRVNYAYLADNPQIEVARRQMRGGGGVLGFVPKGGAAAARAFADALQVITIASSLGGVETIVEIPGELDWNETELDGSTDATGIPPGYIRLSVGIEDLSDIIEDLQRGLDAVGLYLGG